MTAALSPGVSSAVPIPLVLSTLESAALFCGPCVATVSPTVLALVQGVLKTMFISKMKAVLAVGIAVGLFATSTGMLLDAALADKSKNRKRPEAAAADKDKRGEKRVKNRIINGRFHSFDSATGTVRAAFKKGGGESTRTFTLVKETKILLDGRAAKPTELTKGTPLQFQFTSDGKTLLVVRNISPVVRGTIVKVDVKGSQIVVSLGQGDKKSEKTYTLAKGARIVIAGKKNADLADLKPGAAGTVTLSADRSRVTGVRIGPPKDRKREDKPRKNKDQLE
jgi:hypothetical protein